jgi:hypothetical protein
MSADDSPQPVPDLSFLEDTPSNPEPQPTEQPAEPAASDKEATVRLFQAEIEKYATRAEARKHYKEIAKTLNCSPQLGYKAEKRVTVWASKKNESKNFTLKIANTPPPTDTPPDNPAPKPWQPIPISEPPGPAPYPAPTGVMAPPPMHPHQMSEAHLAKASKSGWNALCDFADAPEAYLTKEESAELASYLHPILQTRAPQLVNNPEIIGVVGAASIMAPKAKLLMDARKRKKQQEDLAAQNTPPPMPLHDAVPCKICGGAYIPDAFSPDTCGDCRNKQATKEKASQPPKPTEPTPPPTDEEAASDFKETKPAWATQLK